MPSKSKNVRIEQCRVLEKKLELRLQQLDQKGVSKERAQRDPLVKNLKAKIRETKTRIAVADKHVELTGVLAQAKAKKQAELEAGEKASAQGAPAEDGKAEVKQKKQPKSAEKAAAGALPEGEKEVKPKKKAAAADKGTAGDAEPAKKPRKKKEEPKEE